MGTGKGLPQDFGRRVAAARTYAGMSQGALAAALNVASASASSIKAWETGSHQPPPLGHVALIERLSATTGFKEEFFWGDDGVISTRVEISDQLAALVDLIQLLRAELAAHDVATLTQISEVLQTTRDLQGRPPR